MMKSMENDIEDSIQFNGYGYGFLKICKTNTSCNSITKDLGPELQCDLRVKENLT